MNSRTFETIEELNDFINNVCPILNVPYTVDGLTITFNNELRVTNEFYKKAQKDGVEAINTLMAELRENAIKNNLPRVVNRTIEDAFKEVTDAILLGWWVTAKEKCEAITPFGYVTPELKDRILTTINTYINSNY